MSVVFFSSYLEISTLLRAEYMPCITSVKMCAFLRLVVVVQCKGNSGK